MPDPVQPMDIDSVSSTTGGGDKPTVTNIVGSGGRKGRGKAADLYLVSPMLAPATKIRQGTIGTMSPEVQTAFRNKVNAIFSALAFTSTCIHIGIIHTSRDDIAELGEKAVIEGQDKVCDSLTCSRLLVLLLVLCLICGFIGFCMFRCAKHIRARIPLLLLLAFFLPMACAVGDVWLESRAVAFCQGLVTCGSILILLYSSIPIKKDSASFMHMVGTTASLITTIIIAIIINFVIIGTEDQITSEEAAEQASGSQHGTFEWNAPLVQSTASFVVVCLCVTVLVSWLGYDLYKMRGLRQGQAVEGALFLFSDMLLIACLPLLLVFICVLAFGLQGACYELDEEFKQDQNNEGEP